MVNTREVNDNEDFNAPMTADVYSCKNCQNVDRCIIRKDKATCLECGSQDVVLYMRRPTNNQLHAASCTSDEDREEHLTEIDPDWRGRFNSQVDIAWEFYYGH